MKNDILELKKEFLRIKGMGLIQSLRGGSTGLGYTFESLLGKKEDSDSEPDFKSVEIKCKLGYTQAPIVLFNCAPKRDGDYASRYIYENYGHFRNGSTEDIKIFQRTVFANYTTSRYGYEFRLKVDYNHKVVIMKSYKYGAFVENVCYWNFEELEAKLRGKLTTLALVTGYPYRRENKEYYKYFSIEFYRLRGFFEFLQLIESDKISISFYIKEGKTNIDSPRLVTSGVAFRIKKENLSELFYKLNY